MIGYEGLSFLLLRACRVTDAQLQMLLQPYNMAYPNTEQQLVHMSQHLRRIGHMLERAPGNLATAVRSNGAFPSLLGGGPV